MWDCGIWSTMPYSLEEMIQIVSIRAETETIDVDEEALAYMVCGRYVCMVVWCFAGATSKRCCVSFFQGEVGSRTSLRYAVQLLTPSKIIAQTAGREKITAVDVEEVDELFFDAKASAKLLAKSEGYLS